MQSQSTSPSHHRDLSMAERSRVQTVLQRLESTLQQVSVPSESAAAGAAVLPALLQELQYIIQSDDYALCGGLVKTTRIVPLLRKLFDLNLDVQRQLQQWSGSTQHNANPSSTEQWMNLTVIGQCLSSCVADGVRSLHYLILNSHSRKSFSGILPSHAGGFLELLRHCETMPTAVNILSHVFLCTQEAKDVLDTLVSQYDLLTLLQYMCHDVVVRGSSAFPASLELQLLTRTVSLLSAIVSVTPKPESTVLDVVQKLMTTVLLPFSIEREPTWIAGTLETANQQQHGVDQTSLSSSSEQGQEAVTEDLIRELHCEVLQLVSVLELEGHPCMCVEEVVASWEQWHMPSLLPQPMVQFWRSCVCASSTSTNGSVRPAQQQEEDVAQERLVYIIRRFKDNLNLIRRMNLDAEAVHHSLLSMHRDVVADRGAMAETCAFVIGRLPGGIKTLCATLSTVDEDVSSVSCAVLTGILNATPQLSAPSSSSSSSLLSHVDGAVSSSSYSSSNGSEDYRRNPVYQFVALDGVLLLSDMLDDYSDDVLAGAVGLLGAVAWCQQAQREMQSSHVLRKVRSLVKAIGNRLSGIPADAAVAASSSSPSSGGAAACDGGSTASIIPLSALCAEFLAKLPSDVLSVTVHGPLNCSYSSTCDTPEMAVSIRHWWQGISQRLRSDVAVVTSTTSSSPFSVVQVMNPFLRFCLNVASTDAELISQAISWGPTDDGSSGGDQQHWTSTWIKAAEMWGGGNTDAASAIFCTLLLVSEHLPILQDAVSVVHGVTSALFTMTVFASADFLPPVVVTQRNLLMHKYWSQLDRLCASREPLNAALKATLVETLRGSVRMVAASCGSRVGVQYVVSAAGNLLRRWSLHSSVEGEDIVTSFATVTVHPDVDVNDRDAALSVILDAVDVRLGLSSTSEGAPSHSPLGDSLPLLLTKVIVLCEDAAVEEAQDAERLANRCFERLMRDACNAVPLLLSVARAGLDMLSGDGHTAATTPLSWMGYLEDSDDAHDILVAVMPLVNGLLNQQPESRWSIVSDTNHIFTVFKLLSAGSLLELPLKVLAVYALWHLLELPPHSCIAPEAKEGEVAVLLREWEALSTLQEIMVEAGDVASAQSPEAVREIRSACFMLAEKLILTPLKKHDSDRSSSSGVISDAVRFVATTVFTAQDVEPQACSLLLCVLQDDDARRYFCTEPSLASQYAHTLQQLRHALQQEIVDAELQQSQQSQQQEFTHGGSSSRAYYALLQVEKYVSEIVL